MQHLIERAMWSNQRRKRLADPVADVFFLVVLAVTLVVLIAILVFAGYTHP